MKFVLLFLMVPFLTNAQTDEEIIQKVRAKLDRVNDYSAEGRMKIDVSFIKAPPGKVNVYYKKPDRFKVKKDGGISILPKGGVSINLNSIITKSNYTVIPAGETTIAGTKVKIIKLLPLDESSDVVLTTMYIDPINLVIRKWSVTTRESGTYEVEMTYGKYIDWGLPDKIVFLFNTKDYRLPKGVIFEYDNGKKPTAQELLKNKNNKGSVEITYSSYQINKGVKDEVFK